MRIIIFILVICSVHFSCVSQVIELDNGNTDLEKSTKLDLSGIWYPYHEGRTTIGSIETSFGDPKEHIQYSAAFGYTRNNQFDKWGVVISSMHALAGASYPFYWKKYYVEPSTRFGYHYQHRDATNGFADYSGFALAGGVRIGYLFGRLGLGLKVDLVNSIGWLNEEYSTGISQDRMVVIFNWNYGIAVRFHIN